MNSNTKGSIVELQVSMILMRKGFSVFTPIADGSEVDIIALSSEGETLKIQVKSVKKTKVGFRVDVRRCLSVHRHSKTTYNSKMIDYFAFVHENSLYLIPYDVAIQRNCQFTVRLTDKYGNNDNLLLGADYLL